MTSAPNRMLPSWRAPSKELKDPLRKVVAPHGRIRRPMASGSCDCAGAIRAPARREASMACFTARDGTRFLDSGQFEVRRSRGTQRIA